MYVTMVICEFVKHTHNQKLGNPCVFPGTWCCTSEGMAADSESRDMSFHLKVSPTGVVRELLHVAVIGVHIFMCFK